MAKNSEWEVVGEAPANDWEVAEEIPLAKPPSLTGQIASGVKKLFGMGSVMDDVPADLAPATNSVAKQTLTRLAGEKELTRDRRQNFATTSPVLSAAASGSAKAVQGMLDSVPLAADAVNLYATNPILQAVGMQPMGRASRVPGAAELEQAAKQYSPPMAGRSLKGAWNNDQMLPWLATNLAQQAPQVSQSIGAAFLPAARAPLLLGMGAQSGGNAYQTNKAEGFGYQQSIVDALNKGQIESLSEMLPLGVFDKVKGFVDGLPLPARSGAIAAITKRLMAGGTAMGVQGVTGAIEESIAQLGGNASDIAVLGKDKSLLDKVPESAVIGAVAGKVLGAPNAVHAFNNTPEAQIARVMQEGINNTEYATPAAQIASDRLSPDNAQMRMAPPAQPPATDWEVVAEEPLPTTVNASLPAIAADPVAPTDQPLAEGSNEQASQPAVLVNDPQPVPAAPVGAAVDTDQAQEVAQPNLQAAAGTDPVATPGATQAAPANTSIESTDPQNVSIKAEEIDTSLPAPAKLDGDHATQVTTASPGMRPGDIVAASGKPFATPELARIHAKAAGTGWTVKKGAGGHVVRHQPPTDKQIANGKRQAKNAASIDTTRDSLFAAIAKLGGVSEAALTKEWGFDPAEFKNLRQGIKPLMRKTGGMTLDGMAQRLAELGYISVNEQGQFDQAEMYDLFDGELRGNKHFTPAGFENNAQAQKDAEYDAWVKEQDAAELDSLPDDLQNHIEEVIDDHDANEDEESRIEREAINAESERGLEATDGELDRIPGFEEEGDRPAAETVKAAQDGADPEERTADAAQSTGVNDFDLTGETLDQAKQRTDREDADRKQAAQADKQADQRAQADSERDSFTLTGSNRSADIAASQGQTGMFDDVPFSRKADDGSDIPAPYFQKTQVTTDVWITDEARFDTADVSAQEALDSVREDQANYKKLLDCMRG